MNKELTPLEAFNKIAKFTIETGLDDDHFHEVELQHHKSLWRSFRKVETALKDYEKKLKVLEIIKDTCDFEFLEVKTPFKTNYIIRFEDKNVASNWFNSYLHSKEEFDLLKEVLK